VLANNSRHRIVTFRLSSDEYESVFFACQAEGARTVSEFARDSVLSRARRDATGPQSIVKWLMAVTEKLSVISRQTAEIIPLIRAQQTGPALAVSEDTSLAAVTPAPNLNDRRVRDAVCATSVDNMIEEETLCDSLKFHS
jgi:hypothetical protein